MRPELRALVALLLLGTLVPSVARAAAPIVAYVDIDDRYTSTPSLAAWLEGQRRVRAIDVTKAVRRGRLGLYRSKVFIVGSFATSDDEIRAGLQRAAPRIRRFLRKGGTVVVLAQADEDAPSSDWLPDGLRATRGEPDAPAFAARDGGHVLLRTPRTVADGDLRDWTIAPARVERASSATTVTDAFVRLEGFQIVGRTVGRHTFPAFVVGAYGKGRVVLLQLPVDRVAQAGTTDASRAAAGRLLKNLLRYGLRKHPRVKGRRGAEARPDPSYQAPRSATVRGEVFVDADGDGARDAGERPLAGATVSLEQSSTTTDPDGRFSFRFDPTEPALVSVSVPAGHAPSGPWWRDVATTEGELRFGLKPVDEPDGTLVLAQLTDLHVGAKPEEATRELFASARRIIAAHEPPVDAVVVTGDLTASGAPAELAQYKELVGRLRVPVLQNMGNHDLSRGPDRGAAFRRMVGPWAWDREIAGHRLVATYDLGDDHPATAWARERLHSTTLPTVLLVHHFPRRAFLDALGRDGLRASLSGDWHDSSVRVGEGGVVHVNSAPSLMGGWDHSPPAVRFLTVAADGTVSTELRYVGIDEQLRLSGGAVPRPAGEVSLVVHAYDSLAPVSEVRYRVDGQVGTLTPCGTWTWCVRLPEPLPAGRHTVALEATAADGRTWRRDETLELAVTASSSPSELAPDAEWPMHGRDVTRSSRAPIGVRPPLRLAWQRALGMEVYAAAPIVAQGLVIVAGMDRQSPGAPRAAVVAIELADGQERWRFSTGSSVRHSPVAVGDKVVFQQTDGTTVALRLASGELLWRHVLAETAPPRHVGYYALAAPLVADGRVYVGPSVAPHVLDLATGALLATGRSLDGAAGVTHASPLLAEGRVLWPTRNAGLVAFRPEPAGDELLELWQTRRLAISATPVARGRRAYVRAHGKLLTLDTRRGRQRRALSLRGGTSPSSPVVDRALTFLAETSGVVLAVDRAGRERWRAQVDRGSWSFLPYRSGGDALTATPARAGILLYVASVDGSLRVLEAQTGSLLSSQVLGMPLTSQPIVAAPYVLAVDFGGVLHCLEGSIEAP